MTPVSLCYSNDLQLVIQKDVFFLKMLLCFGFCGFGFEAITHPNCYLISIMDETHYGPIIATFSV